MLTVTLSLLLVVAFAFGNPDKKISSDEAEVVKRVQVPYCVLNPDAPNCEKRLIAYNPFCITGEVYDPDCPGYFKRDAALVKRVVDYCKIHSCITEKKQISSEYCINYPHSYICSQGSANEYCMEYPNSYVCRLVNLKTRGMKRDNLYFQYCRLHPEHPSCLIVKRSSGDDIKIVQVPICVIDPNSSSCRKRLMTFDPNCLVDYYDPYCPYDFKKDVAALKRVADYCKLHACVTEKKREITVSQVAKKSYGNPLPDFMCKLLQDDSLCSYYKKKNVREVMSILCVVQPHVPDCQSWRKRDDSWMFLEMICEENPNDLRCLDKWW